MKKYYSDETKNQTVQEFINGKSVSKIHAETGISRSTIYIWIESQKESLAKYMTFYNTERPHTIIKYWTPDKWESKYWNKNNRT